MVLRRLGHSFRLSWVSFPVFVARVVHSVKIVIVVEVWVCVCYRSFGVFLLLSHRCDDSGCDSSISALSLLMFVMLYMVLCV